MVKDSWVWPNKAIIRPNKKKIVFLVTGLKNLGRVHNFFSGIFFYGF